MCFSVEGNLNFKVESLAILQGSLWDDDYEFKAECFSNCFGLWSRCPSRIHLKDPPKPHTLMALNGVITPRDERSEVFVLSLRSSTKCWPRSCPSKLGRDARPTHLFILRLWHCKPHYQIDNGKLFCGCKIIARGV